jgi:hypothetical protein
MNKNVRNGTVSSILMLALSISFLILVLSLGSSAPSNWGFISVYETSSFAFNIFTYAVIISLLSLPCWTIAIYSLGKLFFNRPFRKFVFIITLIAVICLIIVYLIELTVARSSMITLNGNNIKPDHLLRLDSILFLLDNVENK